MAEALGVQLVVGVVSVHDDAACEEVIRVIGAEVESPLIHTVGGAANIIVGSIVADAEAGAQGLQHIVLGLGHMLDGGILHRPPCGENCNEQNNDGGQSGPFPVFFQSFHGSTFFLHGVFE